MVGVYPISEAYRKEDDKRETFADSSSDGKDTTKTIQRIFLSVGLMVLAIVIGFIFLWAYRKERTLMIVVLSVVVFIYSLLVLVFSLVQRDKLDYIYFTMLMGGSAFMTIMTVLLIIVFSIIASQRMGSQDTLGSQTRDYLSRSQSIPSASPSYEPPSPSEF